MPDNKEFIKQFYSKYASDNIPDGDRLDRLSEKMSNDFDGVVSQMYSKYAADNIPDESRLIRLREKYGIIEKKNPVVSNGISEDPLLDGKLPQNPEIPGSSESSETGLQIEVDIPSETEPIVDTPINQEVSISQGINPLESPEETDQDKFTPESFAANPENLKSIQDEQAFSQNMAKKYTSSLSSDEKYTERNRAVWTEQKEVIQSEVFQYKKQEKAFMDEAKELASINLSENELAVMELRRGDLINKRNNLLVKQKMVAKEDFYLAEDEFKEKVKEGNFFGATWNAPLSGLGKVAAGFEGFVYDAFLPKANIFTKGAKEARLESVRKGFVDAVGHSKSEAYRQKHSQSMIGGAWFGALESLPSMAAMYGSAGVGTGLMFLQMADAAEEEMTGMEGISDNEKVVVKTLLATTASLLEKAGISNVIKNKAVSKIILNKVLKATGKDVTAEGLEAALKKEATTFMGKYGNAGVNSFLAEAETGGLQEVSDIGIKSVVNNTKGKELFDNPDNVVEYVEQLGMAAFQEGLGALALGQPAMIAQGLKQNNLTKKSNNAQFNFTKELIENDEAMGDIFKVLQKKVTAGEMTQNEFDIQSKAVNEAKVTLSKMPPDFTTEQQRNSFDLLTKKSRLTDELTELRKQDETLAETNISIKKAEIDKVNIQLAEIANPAPKIETETKTDESTKAESGVSGVVETKTKEVVKAETEAKSAVKEEVDKLAVEVMSPRGNYAAIEVKMNNAEHINDKEVDNAVVDLLQAEEDIDKMDISEEAKTTIKNELLELAYEIDNYEFRTKTVAKGQTVEGAIKDSEATTRQKAPKKPFKKTIGIVDKKAMYVTSNENGTVSITSFDGNTSRTTQGLTLKGDYAQIEDDGTFISATFTDTEGNKVVIKDEASAIPLLVDQMIKETGDVTEDINYIKEQESKSKKESATKKEPVISEKEDSIPKKEIRDTIKEETDGLNDKDSFRQAFEEYVDSTSKKFRSKIKDLKKDNSKKLDALKSVFKTKEQKRKAKEADFKERKSQTIDAINEYLKKFKDNKYFPSELSRAIKSVGEATTSSALNNAVKSTENIIYKSSERTFIAKANKMREKAKNYYKKIGVQFSPIESGNELDYYKNNKTAGPVSSLGFSYNAKLIDSMLDISPELIPDDAKSDYASALEQLAGTPGGIDQLMAKVKNVIDAVETEQSAIPVLADMYQEEFGNDSKNYSANVDLLMGVGMISPEDGRIMVANKKYIIIKEPKTEAEQLEELKDKAFDMAEESGIDDLPDGFFDMNKQEVVDFMTEIVKSDILGINGAIDRANIDNEYSKQLADRLKQLTDTDLTGLSLREMILVFKATEQAVNGYISNVASVSLSKVMGERGRRLVDINSRSNVGGLSLLSKTKAFMSERFGGDKSAAYFKIMSIPKYQIGVYLGDVKHSNIYREGGTRQLALAQSKFDSEMERANNELLEASEGLEKESKGNPEKIFNSKARIQMYRVKREFDSNQGSDQVNTIKDYVEVTIAAEGNGRYSEKTKARLAEILSENSTEDGNLDLLKLSEAELKVIETIDRVNKFIKPKAEFSETVVRGKKFNPLVNYNHLTVKGSDKTGNALDEAVKQYANPSARAGAQKKRSGNAAPISFDPIASAQNGVREVLMDFHLTPAIREINEIHKRVAKDAATKDAKEVAKAMNQAYEETKQHILPSNFSESHWADALEAELVKKSYQAILAGVDRSVAEISSNMLYAYIADPDAFGVGFKVVMGNEFSPDILDAAISNTETTQEPRLTGNLSLGSKSVDLGLMSQGKLTKSKNLPSEIEVKTAKLRKVISVGYKSVDDVATWLLSAPDKTVGRVMYLGAISNEFNKITGSELDIYKLATDEAYGLKNKKALSDASFKADQLIQNAISSQNPVEGIGKNQKQLTKGIGMNMIRIADGFMTTFAIGEFSTSVVAIKNLHGEGDITSGEAKRLLLATVARMVAYNQVKGLVLSGIVSTLGAAFGWAQEEEDEERFTAQGILRDTLSAISQLIVGRNMGSITKGLINHFIAEPLNEEYGAGITRKGEYNKYKNSMFHDSYSGVDNDKKLLDLLTSLTGGYQSITKAAMNGFRLGMQYNKEDLKSTGKKRESDEIKRDDSTLRKERRLMLDVAKATGILISPKDLDFLVKHYIYDDYRRMKAAEGEKRPEMSKEALKAMDPELYMQIEEMGKERMSMMEEFE